MNKGEKSRADKLMEQSGTLEGANASDKSMHEAIGISQFEARLARIPTVFDRPVAAADVIELLKLFVEWLDKAERDSSRPTRRSR